MQLMTTLMKFTQGQTDFIEKGIFPEMTAFDLQLATKHEAGAHFEEGELTSLLEEAEENGTAEILNSLPGPWQDCKTSAEKMALLQLQQKYFLGGMDVFAFAKWQRQYGDSGLSSNIVVPKIQPSKPGSSKRIIVPRVILANPADAERVARMHIRKEGNFKNILYDSLIATDDNEHWRKQRDILTEAFLPLSSLAEIMPVSLSRAKHCADRLRELSKDGRAVDMSDFLLHETQAQLQLALLGASEAMMESTNEDVRAAFMGDVQEGKVGALGNAMKSLMKHAAEDPSLALPSDGRPVRGPLSRSVQKSSDLTPADNYGNVLLILFAGHDTTGHTMAWLMLELARNPALQREVQSEVDAFFTYLGGRDPTYQDLGNKRLDLLDRCITESLRMWPAVASGTYRQLQFADTVKGPNGQDVQLPKGTPMNIVNWSRHRNETLWGADANEFNPKRDFRAEELARVGCAHAARNPQSERFSPFAHNPRSCLGKNFAQLEMRLILCYLLKRFTFSLAGPYSQLRGQPSSSEPEYDEFRGVNRGTMGPMDLERSSEHSWGTRYVYALKMEVSPRG